MKISYLRKNPNLVSCFFLDISGANRAAGKTGKDDIIPLEISPTEQPSSAIRDSGSSSSIRGNIKRKKKKIIDKITGKSGEVDIGRLSSEELKDNEQPTRMKRIEFAEELLNCSLELLGVSEALQSEFKTKILQSITQTPSSNNLSIREGKLLLGMKSKTDEMVDIYKKQTSATKIQSIFRLWRIRRWTIPKLSKNHVCHFHRPVFANVNDFIMN